MSTNPYRPVPATMLGTSVFGWLRGLFGVQPVYKAPPAMTPAPTEPAPQEPEPAPEQGDSDCVQGPVTIVIAARD